MREIKFRAWDTKSKSWLIYWSQGQMVENKNEEVIVQQFTGLHDKKGKEIYEGDICKALMSGIIDQNFISIIEMENGCFGIRSIEDGALVDAKGKFKDFYGCKTNERIEVIGNIYENQELLNT